jgi:hypothetical protein
MKSREKRKIKTNTPPHTRQANDTEHKDKPVMIKTKPIVDER